MPRTDRETWQRLLFWDQGQALSERLAADVLESEGFTSVNPSHPLGGPDGLKDIVLEKSGRQWIAAAYFPNGEKSASDIERKFRGDLAGVPRNNADGFVFITNQEMRLGLRAALEDLAGNVECEIYHLERLRVILDSLRGLRLRHRYLHIPASESDTYAAVDMIGSVLNTAAAIASYPTPRREVRLELPSSGDLSIDELTEHAEEQRQFELHRGYVLIRNLLPALSNPENPVNPIIKTDGFPDQLVKCHCLTHETAMLTLLLHRCIGLEYTERLSRDGRERITLVVERLWRCVIRLRPLLDDCQCVLLMVASSRSRHACAHLLVHMCGTHLLQEMIQASEQTGYTTIDRALSSSIEQDELPYDPQPLLDEWPRIVESLSNNSTIHDGFFLLGGAFNEIAAEFVRASRYEMGLPIVPAWMVTPE